MINQPFPNLGAHHLDRRLEAHHDRRDPAALMAAPRPFGFTRRERQIVEQLALGKRNKEIGFALGLSEGTVKVYLSRLKQKDPEHNNRYSLAKYLLRDHERVMAIRLNDWIAAWGVSLPEPALLAIQGIMADQVCKVLSGIERATPKQREVV
jgi:DNA-binding CsgD family transcriptional regulator